jgi:hypothetical protein
MKPELTPARSLIATGQAWRDIHALVDRARLDMWQEAISRVADQQTLWALPKIYDFRFETLPSGIVWEKFALPLDRTSSGEISEYRLLHRIQQASINESGAWTVDGAQLNCLECLPLLYAFSRLTWLDGKLALKITPPEDAAAPWRLGELLFGARVVRFGSLLEPALFAYSVGTGFFVNYGHALAQLHFSAHYSGEDVAVRDFFLSWGRPHYCLPPAWLSDYYESADQLRAARHHVGHHFVQVDWTQQPASVKPPYRIFLEDGTWVEITEQDLLNWSQSPGAA